jgi:splicing suppressor protein 51
MSSQKRTETTPKSGDASQSQLNSPTQNQDTEFCKACKKSADTSTKLSRCAGCYSARYCSRDCQKQDWKLHKKVCKPCFKDKPFHGLDNGTWLFDRPPRDVYTLLIDTYRMRMEDEYSIEQDNNSDSLYSGGGTKAAIRGLGKFLIRAENKHHSLLPEWWTEQSRKECEALAKDTSQWADISCCVEKSDIIEHYKDPLMPMQLRMFAEQIYDRPLMGQSGDLMRKRMMMGEAGTTVASHIDLASKH